MPPAACAFMGAAVTTYYSLPKEIVSGENQGSEQKKDNPISKTSDFRILRKTRVVAFCTVQSSHYEMTLSGIVAEATIFLYRFKKCI